MPTRHVVTLAAVATLASLAPSPPADAPEVEIRKLLDRQAADWNAGDLDGFLVPYWNSPDLVFQSGGTRTAGFEATRDRYRKRYKGEGREMGKLAFRDVEVVPLGPDAAMARGRWGLAMSDGKKPGGLFTLVLRRFKDGWKIVHDHTSSDAP